jgi:hypothetical protein
VAALSHARADRRLRRVAARLGFAEVAAYLKDRHVAKRDQARERSARVAKSAGFDSITGYLSERRADGWTWRAIAAESGQPESWLRRHARPA